MTPAVRRQRHMPCGLAAVYYRLWLRCAPRPAHVSTCIVMLVLAVLPVQSLEGPARYQTHRAVGPPIERGGELDAHAWDLARTHRLALGRYNARYTPGFLSCGVGTLV